MTQQQWSDHALVIAAHGDRGGADENRSLIEHGRRLRESGEFRDVTCGFLNAEPTIETAFETALQSAGGAVLVYPFFMSAGYFASTVLRRRLASLAGNRPVPMLAPFGEARRLPQLLVARAIEAAQAARFAIPDTRLLIVGHGSGLSRASHDATVRFRDAAVAHSPFAQNAVAFLEEDPFLEPALAGSDRPTVVAGFLCGSGLHGDDDVPAAIARSGSPAVYSGPIGTDPETAAIILEACREFARRQRPEKRAAAWPVSV